MTVPQMLFALNIDWLFKINPQYERSVNELTVNIYRWNDAGKISKKNIKCF